MHQQPLAVFRPSPLPIIWLLWIIMGFDFVNQDHSNALKLELGLSSLVVSSEVGISQPKEEHEVDELSDADWSNLTEVQLEELLLSNLDTIFMDPHTHLLYQASGSTPSTSPNTLKFNEAAKKNRKRSN
ncbi:hypothetical protein S245_021414 [Arachis hypogaea]